MASEILFVFVVSNLLWPDESAAGAGAGATMFNGDVDENQTTTNHDGLQNQGMRP